MYIYYVLRGRRANEPVELDGEVNAEILPDIDLDDGPAIISALVNNLRQKDITDEWEACDLTDSFFEREDNYIFFDARWMRRSDAPWRKDRAN